MNKKQDLFVEVMLSEASRAQEIEDEYLSRGDVMPSLKANLGIKNYRQNNLNKKANAIEYLVISINKITKATATRDLQHFCGIRAL